MDLTKQPLFRMMTERMNYLGERQKVLAENIANADTPKFKASDLKPLDFSKELHHHLQMVATDPNHLQPLTDPGEFTVDHNANPYEVKPNGNSVILEQQSVKEAQTQIDYQTTTNLYAKYIGMIKLVLAK